MYWNYNELEHPKQIVVYWCFVMLLANRLDVCYIDISGLNYWEHVADGIHMEESSRAKTCNVEATDTETFNCNEN